MNINWKENQPFSHNGRWVKKYQSIMNPEEKVTWPQLIAEFVIYWRSKMLKNYPKIQKGKGWSNAIQKQVRDLNQQAAVICNYFPHPDDEPLVVYAVKKYFREQKPLKIGRFRKNRITNKNGRDIINITQDEKDVVLGISAELAKAIKTRESYNTSSPTTKQETVANPTFDTQKNHKQKRGSLSYLLELEKELKSQKVESE